MRAILNYKAWMIAALLLVCSMSKSSAQDVNYKSYTLFVYNFMKYIEWPPETAKGDFVIGVMGDSPIMAELQNLAKTKKVKGKSIVIKKISTVDEAAACQLVYISPSKSSMLKTINEKTKGKAVLLVGEREGLAEKGAGISFVTLDDDVLKFDINKSVIEQRSLKIPGSLISLGIVVD